MKSNVCTKAMARGKNFCCLKLINISTCTCLHTKTLV